MTDETDGLETEPAREGASVCSYCGRPFADERLLALHRGQTHRGELGDNERAAFEDAYADEQAEIREFRLKALGALVLLYFGFLIVYAIV